MYETVDWEKVWRTAFYQEYFKYYINDFAQPAFNIFYDKKTKLAIARQGEKLYYYPPSAKRPFRFRLMEGYYIGQVHYEELFGSRPRPRVFTFYYVTQISERFGMTSIFKWKEPDIGELRNERLLSEEEKKCVDELLQVLSAHLNTRVGKRGTPILI
jgi:hypothetical protein